MSDQFKDLRLVVTALPRNGVRPNELARTMVPHPLIYQELPYNPEYTICNRRLASVGMDSATVDEVYWMVRRKVILRHTGELWMSKCAIRTFRSARFRDRTRSRFGRLPLMAPTRARSDNVTSPKFRSPARRLSSATRFTNELGWEFYLEPDIDTRAVGEHILEAGKPLGMVLASAEAFRTRRIDAGLLNAGSDFGPGVTPFAAGLGLPSDFVRKGLVLLLGGYVGDLAAASYPHIHRGGGDPGGPRS